jgi:repressor LexA
MVKRTTRAAVRYTGEDKPRMQRVFDFIVSWKITHDGNSPVMREIMTGCKISSTSMVSFYLDMLTEQGLIRRPERFSSGNIEVVGGEWELGNV